MPGQGILLVHPSSSKCNDLSFLDAALPYVILTGGDWKETESEARRLGENGVLWEL